MPTWGGIFVASTKDLRDLAEMLEDPSLQEMHLLLDQQPAVARVNLLEDDLPELTASARKLRNMLERKAKLEDFFQLTPYEPGYPNEENQLVHLDPTKFPEFAPLIAVVKGTKAPELGTFKLEWPNVKVELRTFLAGSEELTIVRHVPRANILTPKGPKKFFALSKGILQMQSREGISFDNTIDAFLWRGNLYMVHVGSIENAFDLKAVLEANAEDVVNAIQKAVQIPGLESIVELAKGNLPLLRKLRRISQQDYLAQLKISLLEKVATANKLTNIKFTGSGAQRRLDFAASNKNDVLKLLDDDYLFSELTNRRYSVRDQAKKPL